MTDLRPYDALLTGHFCFGEVDGNVLPCRFTPEQQAHYTALSDYDFCRCFSSTGIGLHFTTDAAEISFDWELLRPFVINSGLDLYEDGVFSAHFDVGGSSEKAGRFVYARRASGVRSRIDIRFPMAGVFAPSNLSLGDARPVPKPEKTALFYGDSIAMCSYIPTPSVSWAELTAGALGMGHLNRGVGSYYFDDRSLPSVRDCDPSVIFIEYGFNDIGHYPDETERLAAAENYLRKLKNVYAGVPAAVITTDFGWGAAKDEAGEARRAAYCGSVAEIARDLGMTVIRGGTLVPRLPLMFVGDQVHLSEAGSALFAHNLACAVRERGLV